MEDKIKGRTGNLGNKETMSDNIKRYLAQRGLNARDFSNR